MFESIEFRLAVALAIGFVVGVERGWQEREGPRGSRTAGIRTFGLLGLLGGVLAAVSQSFESPMLFGLGLLVASAVFAWFKFYEATSEHDFSVTGVVAAMVVLVLGGYAVVGEVGVAAAGGVAVAILLAARHPLHGWLRNLTWLELRSAFILLTMTVLVLPVLPDRAIDPYGAVNPRQIWLVTVLAGAISFGGYLAVKLVGTTKGLVATGLGAGLISSTLVTVQMAQRSRDEAKTEALVGASLLAAMVSMLRTIVLASVVQPALLVGLTPAALAAAVVFGGLGTLQMVRGRDAGPGDHVLGDPLDLRLVLTLGASIAAVGFVLGWMAQNFSSETIYGAALLTGLADLDALTLATARLAGQSVALEVAALAILLATASNAAARVVFAVAFGSRRFALQVGASTVAAAFVGALVYALLP